MNALNVSCLAKSSLIAAVLTIAGCSTSSVGVPDKHQAEMNAYCTALAKGDADQSDQFKGIETFFSWKIHTCVQSRIYKNQDYFSYELADISHGFLRGPSIAKKEMPLMVHLYNDYGMASADGYWDATDTGKDKQLISSIVANIQCNRDEKVCKERDGTLFMGMLGSDEREYKISSWSAHSIVADGDDDEKCGIGHRLIVDADSKSVVVNDYPKKLSNDPDCKAVQTANSFALKGGSIFLYNADGIFSCTKDGVNSANISKVNELRGKVSDQKFDAWNDDGVGGAPASVKKAVKPFTQEDCDSAMQKKMTELKAD